MMSTISATAVAPSGKIKRNQWTVLRSTHRACFYNTYGSPVSGRYAIKLIVAGKETIAYDSVGVAGGEGFCITQYLQMWVNAKPGTFQTTASTHVEMDGQETNNEGHGTIEVR